ncbi:MAG TPA: hypothetical protein VJT09_09140 [Pyrinomonadaceae bacterium]|nr:hypothetical protein [Pyrinomonadaceae bacterium]
MFNPTEKPYAARLYMALAVSLLIGVLAIQCQPLNSSSRAANNSIPGPQANTPQPIKDENPAEKQDKLPPGRRPVAVIYEHNPWATVIGSDSPSFALYDDGLVIFARRVEGKRGEYFSAVLTEQERSALVSSLPVEQFFKLEPRYETTLMTDQPTTVMYLWHNGERKAVSVYGGLRRTDNDRGQPAPAAFTETYEKLHDFELARATPWMPEKIEMMVWPYDAAGDALSWPKNWPDTNHPETKKRGDGSDSIAYSIYLTRQQYETFRERASASSQNAVLINGRKWAFSFRLPFPGEDVWRKR